MAIDKTMNTRERCKSAFIRPGQLSIRRQRIENWAYKDRSVSINTNAIGSENSLFQADRRLNIQLLQLSEQREKLIKQHNFDQNSFANKQTLRHKDNQAILSTLNYVRKCCKYSNMNDNEEQLIDPFKKNKTTRSRSGIVITPTIKQDLSSNTRIQTNTSLIETFLKHNKKHIESSKKLNEKKTPLIAQSTETSYNKCQKRHVQFQIHTRRDSQSAYVSNRSSTHELRSNPSRTINSAPSITITDHTKEQIKISPKIKQQFSGKTSLQQFRYYPERFLSKTNRYLPLLRRQAKEIKSHESYIKQLKQISSSTSHLFEGSDLSYDDIKSFLSEETQTGKSTINSHIPISDGQNRRNIKKLNASNKIDLMETVTDNISERTIALSRLRDREYAHLQKLIHSNSIEHILQPLSSIKTFENKEEQLKYLNNSTIIDKYKRKQIDIEQNLSKLGILIF